MTERSRSIFKKHPHTADITPIICYLAGWSVSIDAELDITGDGKVSNRDVIALIAIMESFE